MHAGGVDDAGRVRLLPEEPFLETVRFSHVRTPSIHGICTAQAHQLLAKIVAKSRRARGPVALAEILPAKPKAPRSSPDHREHRRTSPRAPPPCVSVQKWAPLCAPTPIGQHWWAHSGPFMLLGPPFIHYAWPRRYTRFPRSTLHAHTVGNKAVHQTSSRS